MIDLSEFAPSRPAMLLHGDIRQIAKLLPSQSVAMIATSPPYYNLRDYKNGSWIGGNPECDHLKIAGSRNSNSSTLGGAKVNQNGDKEPWKGGKCGKCGAIRQDEGIGNEATPEAYIASLVAVFDSLKPALRDDGTLWLNLGDSYSGSGKGGGGSYELNGSTKAKGTRRTDPEIETLGAKQLMGMPWRVALALQAAGWYLRADCIWNKPNAMPESCKDRPSRCHEYVFLFSKSQDYYYDWYAVRQTGSFEANRNLRTVWTINTESYKGAHFAVWPLALTEPMIQAGSSEYGYCGACGKPYTRDVIATRKPTRPGRTTKVGSQAESLDIGNRDPQRHVTEYLDGGFIAACKCNWLVRPGIVLDPFVGSGTTIMAAVALGRYGIGVDLSRQYLAMARERIGGALNVRDSEYYLPKIEKV